MTHQDEFEFGDSKAEIALRKIMLTRDRGIRHYIRVLLQNVSTRAKFVVSDDNNKNEFMYKVLRFWYESKINQSRVAEDPELITYFRNCAIKRLRVILKIGRNK